ncbi:MAG TPA: HAD-IA family hydrolase [Candidatus Saccharimonadales bacterium]
MTQAIIFDCFGVLTTEGWIAFKNQHFGNDPQKMRRATELSRMLDRGLISYEDSVKETAEMAGVSVEELDNTLRKLTSNKPLLEYIRDELKPKYKIGLLSNVGNDWLYTLFTDQEKALFDEAALSFQTGVLKPERQAFEIIAQKLALPPEDCVLVDDLERNITGAQEAGMQAILYKNFDQLKTDLEALLANPKG